eukprot:CCRYP_019813-RB/>CCRYP_019813-RB protein AED:0.01 eAED:0.01 QI:366/1/1/1/1/1/3/407/2502
MSDPFGTPPRTATNTSASSGSPANGSLDRFRDRDDSELLERLLRLSSRPQDVDDDGVHDDEEGDDLYDSLNEMLARFDQDLSGVDRGGWWSRLVDGAASRRFQARIENGATISTAAGEAASRLPPAFQTSEGKSHLRALMDRLGVGRERAVQLTFGTLRSLLEHDAGEHESGVGLDDDERERFLRSLLGTRRLFDQAVSRFRRQFVERLRIFVECLRLDQEVRASADAGGHGVATQSGRDIARFLDSIDARTSINGKKRGLLQFLFCLAAAPLPQGFGANLPYSVSKLRTNNIISGAGMVVDQAGDYDEIVAMTVRKEAVEALLLLLYDRIEGGVQRLDLYLLLEGVSSAVGSAGNVSSVGSSAGNAGLEYLEFGMGATHYLQSGIYTKDDQRRTTRGYNADPFILSTAGTGRESIVMARERLRLSLNGLWALIYAECMGLWRTNQCAWITEHPLFAGLNLPIDGAIEDERQSAADTPNVGLTGRSMRLALSEGQDEGSPMVGAGINSNQAHAELEVLYRKLQSLGVVLRDRRRLAYKNRKQGTTAMVEGDVAQNFEQQDEDDELWGLHAPEGVALLSFGLLLQLVRLSNNVDEDFLSKFGEWGEECAQIANDDCAAFAYLHRVFDGVVVDPLEGALTGLSRRGIGGNLIRDLAGRKDIELLADCDSMALPDTEMTAREDDDEDSLLGLAVDASSVVYSSIGREILSATIRVFRQSLLSLQSSSAVENVGMLVDLAAIIFRHSTPLCEQFWSDWEELNSAMSEDGPSPSSSDESMCFLLDTAHSLASLTLVELSNGGRQEAVIKYMRPLSSFLRFIASLCSSSLVVQSVLTSGFLQDDLISKTLSVCSSLAPLVSTLNDSVEPVTSEERSTIRHATVAIESIAILAYLGGKLARDLIRSSLPPNGLPRMLTSIAFNVIPRKNAALSQECSDFASGALNLLAELLVGADVSFHMETSGCFSSSDELAKHATNGFSLFLRGGIHSNVTLSAMSIMSSLALMLTKNTLDTSVNSRATCAYIEMLRDGVKAGLDVLCSLFSSGEVLALSSLLQVDVSYAVMLSTSATLTEIRSLMYLHKDANVRCTALNVRNDIISTLASSTALGHVIAFLSTSPISMTLTKNSFLHKLTHSIESAVALCDKTNENNNYGAWGRFVTPKRASQKSLQREERRITPALNFCSESGTEAINGESLFLSSLAEIALSLLLVWGGHCGPSSESPAENFIIQSPYTLLMSKASFSSEQNELPSNVSNLHVISRFLNVENVTSLCILSAKVINLCLRHASIAAYDAGGDQATLTAFTSAFARGVRIISTTLVLSLRKLFSRSNDFFVQMKQLSVLAVINLETVALSVSQSNLTKSLLVGEKGSTEFQLIDQLVTSIESTVSLINTMNQNEHVDSRVLRLRCELTSSCLEVILELWKSCRVGSLSDYDACGGIVGHLTTNNANDLTIANVVVELARSSLLAIVSQEERHSMQDDVLIELIAEKSVLIDVLSRCLSFLTIETIARIQVNATIGIKFIAELIEAGPMECWCFLLNSNKTESLAASAWVDIRAGWNLDSFLQACPSEKNRGCPSTCSLDFALRLSRASSGESSSLKKWNALNVLAAAETSCSTSMAAFFDAITISIASLRPAQEVLTLTHSLITGVLAALASTSESKMISQTLLLPQDSMLCQRMEPLEELTSLLLTALTVNNDVRDCSYESQEVLQMFGELFESSSRVFVSTQFRSIDSKSEAIACSIRQKIMTSALILLSRYQCQAEESRSRNELVKYNEVRLGWVDITLNVIQSVQAESSSELLRTSFSFLSALCPTSHDVDSERGGHLTYSYSEDFLICMKQRNAMFHIQNHLMSVSTVASLTYRAVYSGTAPPDVIIIHTNAISVIDKIMTFTLTLTDTSSFFVDILLLLNEARCFRSLIDNPLLKLCKIWVGQNQNCREHIILPAFEHHRGYVSASSEHHKMSHPSETDMVHAVWCKVIQVFSTLLRSLRRQSVVYANIDHSINQRLLPIASAAFDFIASFEETIFSCFDAMETNTKSTVFPEKKGSISTPASTIKTSSFSFTRNLLHEASCLTSLFAELSKGDTKNKFAASCVGIYKKMIPTMLELVKFFSSFLGSIGNARELFSALSSAISLSFDQPSSMFDVHPLLADGIPNARHESIRNSYFASSCCIIVTAEDFALSRISLVSKPKQMESEQSRDSELEQTFHIQVNNKFIFHMENLAGHCLFSVMSVLIDTHPSLDSFVCFSPEEILRLDIAALIRPGMLVSVLPHKSGVSERYVSSKPNTINYGHCTGCDRSTRTISIKYSNDDGALQRQVPWSWISGMEDCSQRHCIMSHVPLAKSIADADTHEATSIGHLILTLRWCRHLSKESSLSRLAMRIADLTSVLMCTEVVLHDELHKISNADEERKINAQLLDLFGCIQCTELSGVDLVDQIRRLPINEGVLKSVHIQMQRRLEAALSEREEEQKLWEQQNSGWDATFWGGSHKREGRRSPFRAFNRMPSVDSSQ